MKKILTLITALLLCGQVLAVPAKPRTWKVTQSDGTTVTVTLRGDENYHYYLTTDGVPLVMNDDGTFTYAVAQDGLLRSSGLLAHDADGRSANERQFINDNLGKVADHITATWSERAARRNQHRIERTIARRAKAKQAPQKAKIVGEKKGLVILVNFKDKKMVHSKDEFNDMFNQEGYNLNKHIGSVRDYFHKQSYGQFTLDFDVVGPYELRYNMEKYGGNNSNGTDKDPESMIIEAVQAANKDVYYPDYDWDGDGEVEQVYVIYAGYGEAQAYGILPNTVWPHEFKLSYANNGYIYTYPNGVKLDGVKIDTYACSNELMGYSGTRMNGMGTACHEFSHCLGLPDYYDTNANTSLSTASTNYGMGHWSLMDQGNYNGPSGYEGSVPAGFTSYGRIHAGWIEPIELDEGCEITDMPAIIDSPTAYIVYNQGNANEYFLLENRQKTSWDKNLPGHGLLVLHVDYNRNVWENNEVNTTKNTRSNNNHQRLTVVPASNSTNIESTIPYPGVSGRYTELTDTSTPAATLYTKNEDGTKLLHRPIEKIKETNGLISFSFNGGLGILVPEAKEATAIAQQQFTANWTTVSDATSYTLELTEEVKGESDAHTTELLNEDFSKISADASTSIDISSSLDHYTKMIGWQGTKVYPGGEGKGIRLGTTRLTGSLTTPTLNAPTSQVVSVLFHVTPWEAASKLTVYTITVTGASGKEYLHEQRIAEEASDVKLSVTGIDEQFTVTFATVNETDYSLRAYFTNIVVVDGNASGSTFQKSLVEGITSTSYSFTNLANQNYAYRVKAITPKGESDWSNTVQVVLPENVLDIISGVSTSGSNRVEVYGIGGVLLRQGTSSNWSNDLPQGTYILKTQNGTFKVRK
jgi:M6 family metalloprotease-like protein